MLLCGDFRQILPVIYEVAGEFAGQLLAIGDGKYPIATSLANCTSTWLYIDYIEKFSSLALKSVSTVIFNSSVVVKI